MGDDDPGEEQIRRHREERREAFETLTAAARRAEQAETVLARELVADFVRRVREQGIEPVALRARGYSARGTFRTSLTGWYLQPAGPLAIGTQGEFYVLTAHTGLASKLTGVDIQPSEPPLAVGRGARDGESMSLKELLEWRLAAGPGFPNRR